MKANHQSSPTWTPFLRARMDRLIVLCREHHLKRLWLFGSVLREADFRPDSDVDVLFELAENRISDKLYLKNLYGFVDNLEELFGRKVDMVHYPSLKNPYFIEEIEETKQLVYDQTRQEIPV
jgi:hypothetical protein